MAVFGFSFGKKKQSSSSVGTAEFEKSKTRKGFIQDVDQLNLSPIAIEKITKDVLGGPGGLAEIFQGEQTAGIFSSSVAAQAAGDFAASLVGEIAKLGAERVKTSRVFEEEDEAGVESQTQRSKGKSSGFDFSFGSGD